MFAARNMILCGAFSPLSFNPSIWLSDTGINAAQWDDLSGNSRHATQGTGANQPSIITGSINGRQIRRFDGVDDILSTSYTPPTSATVIAVVKRSAQTTDASTAIRPYYSSAVDVTNGGFIGTVRENLASPYVAVAGYTGGGTLSTGANTFVNGTANIISVNIQASAEIWINGTSAGSGTIATTTNGAIKIGGDSVFSARRFAGDMAEIIIFPSALSATSRQTIERFLGQKYAITTA